MKAEDIGEIYEIEKISFSLPWDINSFYDELKHPERACYLTAGLKDADKALRILGYGGFWLIADEINIVNIAVHPGYRRQGIASSLLKNLLLMGSQKGAKIATLEVRAGNIAALKFYEKFNFKLIAIRKKYYQDNKEDACVMWLNPIKVEG